MVTVERRAALARRLRDDAERIERTEDSRQRALFSVEAGALLLWYAALGWRHQRMSTPLAAAMAALCCLPSRRAGLAAGRMLASDASLIEVTSERLRLWEEGLRGIPGADRPAKAVELGTDPELPLLIPEQLCRLAADRIANPGGGPAALFAHRAALNLLEGAQLLLLGHGAPQLRAAVAVADPGRQPSYRRNLWGYQLAEAVAAELEGSRRRLAALPERQELAL